MQKLIVSVVMLAFAVALQAGETKTTSNEKEKTACCSSQAKADQAKAGCCSMDKSACNKQATKQQVLMSPKAAAEYAKK